MAATRSTDQWSAYFCSNEMFIACGPLVCLKFVRFSVCCLLKFVIFFCGSCVLAFPRKGYIPGIGGIAMLSSAGVLSVSRWSVTPSSLMAASWYPFLLDSPSMGENIVVSFFSWLRDLWCPVHTVCARNLLWGRLLGWCDVSIRPFGVFIIELIGFADE